MSSMTGAGSLAAELMTCSKPVFVARSALVKSRMSAFGYDFEAGGSDRLRDLIASDHSKYGTIIRSLGIQPN